MLNLGAPWTSAPLGPVKQRAAEVRAVHLETRRGAETLTSDVDGAQAAILADNLELDSLAIYTGGSNNSTGDHLERSGRGEGKGHLPASERKPLVLMLVWCTKKSSPPLVGLMKPKPFWVLNHLTVPV